MPFDPGLAALIRDDLSDTPRVVEKRMFGGIAFMVGGHMAAGVLGDAGIYRPGKATLAEAGALPGVTPWLHSGRPMGGYVLAGAEAMASDATRRRLLSLSLAHVAALPGR